MRPGLTLLRVLIFLVALSPLLFKHHSAVAKTTVTKTGPCAVTITINIELYGSNATQELADRWKENIENTFNGPTAEQARRVASENGLDTKNSADTPIINELAREYLKEAGVPEGCSSVNCCTICFVANVKLRGDEPTSDYHQIEAVPNGAERSHVHHNAGADGEYGLNGQYGSATGTWEDDPTGGWPPEAHETGHLMGLGDRYSDQEVVDSVTGERTTSSVTHEGHEDNIMANCLGWPFEDGIAEILRIGGVECDCCTKTAIGYYQRYGATHRTAGDAILTRNCPILRQLLNDYQAQLGNVMAASISMTDKAVLVHNLTTQIAAVKRALEDCGDSIVAETNEWCTFWDGSTPDDDGDDPRDTPPPTPDDDGDDPRDTPPPVITTTPDDDDGDDPRDTPQDDGDDPRDTPTRYAKGKVRDPDTGDAVTRCRVQLLSAASALPGTNASQNTDGGEFVRSDDGFDEGPLYAVTDEDGNFSLTQRQDASRDIIGMEISLPSFKSYIVKIMLDKSKENWGDPASYLDPITSYMVARSWIVENSMYVVVNIPNVRKE